MDTRWKPSDTEAAIIERDGRFLLVEEHTPEGLRLNNPAGHLDPGESPITACARGPGCGLHPPRTPRASTGEDVTYLRLAFSGALGAREPGRSLDHGIVRTIWMTPDEVRASADRHRSPLVLRCMEDYLQGRRFPLDLVHTDPSVLAPTPLG